MSFMTNLWRSSKLEELLEKNNELTLEILDQDDVFDEARFMNEKLCRLLSTKNSVKMLLEHMLDGPLPSVLTQPNPNRYSSVSCEILNLGIGSVNQVIFENPDLLEQYFDFLRKTPPLPMPNAAYFGKVGVMLLDRSKLALYEYMKEKKSVVEQFVEHIGCSPITDLLLAMIKMDQLEPTGFIKLLYESNFMSGIIKALDNPDSYHTACQFMLDLINASSAPSMLIHQLDSVEIVTKLIEYTLIGKKPPSALGASGLDVINSLLKWHSINVLANFQHYQEQKGLAAAANGSPVPIRTNDIKRNLLLRTHRCAALLTQFIIVSVDASGNYVAAPASDSGSSFCVLSGGPHGELTFDMALEFTSVVSVLSRHFQTLVAILATHPTEPDMRGKIPFGTARLKLLQVFQSFLGTGSHNPKAYSNFVASNLPAVCLDLFFHYEWNNFVHHVVEDIMKHIFDGSSEELKANLFKEARLDQRIIEAFEQPLDSKGYFGHLSRLSQTMIRTATIQQYLDSDRWRDFTLEKIQPIYKLESAQLGSMDLLELFPEMREQILAERGGLGEEEEEELNGPILENEEGEEYQPPTEPQWVY